MNWNRSEGWALAREASSLQPVSTSREAGFRQSKKFLSPPSGSASENRLSYSRTSAFTAVAASTQWMVAPFTLRPSAGSPPRLSGSYSAAISVTLPFSSVS